MTDTKISLLLFACVACFLFAYGTALLNKMGEVLHRDRGLPRPRVLSPFGHAELVRQYAELYEASDARLPRLHRSIRLNRVLLVLVVLAGIGRARVG